MTQVSGSRCQPKRTARLHSHPAEMFPGATPPALGAGAWEAASPTTLVSETWAPFLSLRPQRCFAELEASDGMPMAPRQRGMGRTQDCQAGACSDAHQLLLLTLILPRAPARGLLQGTGQQSVAITPVCHLRAPGACRVPATELM